MNTNEIAFYRALIQNESAVKELGDNNLRDLAKYVTDQLRKSTSVDWQVRQCSCQTQKPGEKGA